MTHLNIRTVIKWVAVLCALAIMLFPIYWMILTSLKPSGEVFQSPPTFWSANLSFDAYLSLFESRTIGRYFLNSAIVAGGTTALSVVLASLAAYGMTRFHVGIAPLIILGLLFIKMLPEALLVVPFFQLIADFNMLNSYASLIVVYTSFSLPFAVWMLIGFFRVIPREIDEAGVMDGANRFQTFWMIVLPMARPGIAAVSMFTFLVAWNAYLWSLVLSTDPGMYVLPVGIATMKGEYQVQWNEMMAAAVIAVLPVLAIYSIFERHLVAGITAGAVKG